MADAHWWASFFDDDYVEAWTAAGFFDRTSEQADGVAALLGTQTGLDVLDVPCGFGRIAAHLHQRGHRVTGMDLSDAQLRLAEERNPGPRYLKGDMRQPPAGPYDAVLNLFSSFGYFTERSDDIAALQAWFAVLRPGGLLIMELMHRDGVAYALGRGQTPTDLGPVRETGVTHWVEGRRTATVTYRGISKTFHIRLYTATELVRELKAVGFRDIDVRGDLVTATPFSPATRLVILARR